MPDSTHLTGLTQQTAQKRLAQYGLNEITSTKISFYQKIRKLLWGPIPWMIEIAAILSLILQRWPDFIMITTLLIINAILELVQEFKADSAVSALKSTLALTAYVKRDEQWQDISASKLVPGDVVLIKLGNIIPADIHLMSGDYLSIDQASLTGESLPVTRRVGDLVYSGTIIKQGEMIGIVDKTGMNTFFGKTASLIDKSNTPSDLQKNITQIGRFLIILTLVICGVVLAHDLYLSLFTHQGDISNSIIFMLVLVIAGIPVALPAVMSVTLAIGAKRLATYKAIVSKLSAIEELATMNVLCSDKTGTLTQNKLKIGEISNYHDYSPEDVIHYACLASNPQGHDAIDEVLFAEQKRLPSDPPSFQIEHYTPFNPTSKKAESLISHNHTQRKVAKGAPQVILNLCAEDTNKAQQTVTQLAQHGYRALTVAVTTINLDSWELVGVISLFDPPREDSEKTLHEIMQRGVSIKMITGDHSAIAQELAHTLHIGNYIMPMATFNNTDPLTQKRTLDSLDGFAEVLPEDKFEIVKALQKNQHIVGMTGDGVNDAPAIKQANVGIAVDGATDAARAAADLVLTQPGLSVITHAINESRKIFGRLKSYAIYRISETVRLLLFLLCAIMVYNTHPLSAIMIIIIALLNDIPIMMIAYDNMTASKDPGIWKMKDVFSVAVALAIVGVISTFGLYWIADHYWFTELPAELKQAKLNTVAFMGILCGGNLTIYLTRNTGMPWHRPFPEWKFSCATLFSLATGTLISVYGFDSNDFIGIGWTWAFYAWLYILIWFAITSIIKMGVYRILNPQNS
ncbi:plasma-membrane proton-efflux P-type ATPase [uncultured Shewanella sp.]|uniref:plasma-membrane proton-efflux P-type ATPase n=1 Tax=uncultured Shewanella sp. TaxID=173975 RepID=UPI002635AA6E|nr:plasma-membrane proton-efflux P-type ATPase [uncultured Shewanella sp.]